MFVQTPAPAGERWKVALATPEPPSAELEETATALPRTFALAAGAVIEPVGLVESFVKVSTVAALVLTGWVVCVQLPVVPPRAGKIEEAGPDPASATAFWSWRLPAAAPR